MGIATERQHPIFEIVPGAPLLKVLEITPVCV